MPTRSTVKGPDTAASEQPRRGAAGEAGSEDDDVVVFVFVFVVFVSGGDRPAWVPAPADPLRT
ncbi:hypothetical protein [Streptomyces sp. NBC_01233]|uniref:hypothetical protein n=1 Tax=Streptomyces sp. NBC_01233 TaxID=2903787 RepID=UPI002E167843|nr:hypothetical protein OG332_35460 [Streptomyces sp. NBC_01233]